ncbi:MAG: carboxypeptidase regulatory-like domain-containing protein [Saprospiraceae bacterium]|nr:carboxypeptidase regulatory-like domain-containing protein [Saprospiraceae bacterium]
MKKQLLITMFLIFSGLTAYAQVTLSGKVTDEKGEPMVGAIVAILKNGVAKTGAQTDIDGLFRITNLDPGKYDVECKMLGYTDQRSTGVQLTTGIINLDFKMVENGKVLDAVIVREYKIPIVKVDQTTQGQQFTSDQIAKMPLKDVNAIVATSAGVSSQQGETPSIKGSRSSGTDYYIDGIRVRGNGTVPVNEIEQLQVVTGGMEAKYGDVVGGIISITTKGPAKKFTGGVELETSQYLDAFKYNFANVNLSGPIITRTRVDKTGAKIKEPVLGFRVSGQMRTNGDPSPPAVPVYKVKDDVLANLEKNPWTIVGTGARVASAELLKPTDFEALKLRPNQDYAQYDFTGKLDLRVNKAIDVTLSGNYYHIDDKVNPSTSSNGDWEVFNSHNNPTSLTDRIRTNFRFRHRLGNTEGGSKSTNTTIENAQYTLQFGYEKNFGSQMDKIHKDNLFNYGYVGQFDTRWEPTFVADSTGIRHDGYRQVFAGYKLSDINPVMANFNRDANGKDLEAGAGGNNLNIFNGVYNRDNLTNVWGFHQNVGRVYNTFSKNEGNLITGQATLNFDLLPGGSKDKAHNIQMGFIYEQRIDRSYSISPYALWNIADQLQNGNINGTGVDTTKYLGRDSLVNGQKVRLYAPAENKDILSKTDILFYKNLRAKTGQSYLSFGNVNNLTPDQLSLSMFTARELNDQALLGYYGYDYLGNWVSADKYSFNDFFTAKDEKTGARLFPVAPLQPLYIAGYIQDKFRYKDVIFSLGVRVDRYDANTKVLKDPYSMYDMMTAKDYYELLQKNNPGKNITKPASVGDDYKVYLTEQTYGKTNARYSESTIRAYRKGDQWYTSTGQPIDPVTLFGENSQVHAKYVSDTFPTITQLGYDPNLSFTDYKPQTNFMPRLGFSFPIGEKANFFAHYDILTARPPSNTAMTALDYFYFDQRSGIKNNPDLKPEKTIDYEVGFQQELTPTSGIKIAAYYKEMRDMIQQRYYRYIAGPLNITEYVTYGNLDFGTVKGFTFQYDLRQTSHFSGQFNYTLQFADGTGSDASSQQGLNRRGNIRALSPLSFDERHRFAFTVDYRYGDSKYDGPMLFGKELFKDAGINLQLVTVSGRPYTKQKISQPFGGAQIDGLINGARLPWNYNLDLRVDKTFTLSKDMKHPLSINAYFRVQNLLDTRNVRSVYRASGSPDDDGYLVSPLGQRTLEGIISSRPDDLEAYRFSYFMRELNPGNYFFPRRMYLGATFMF